MNNFKKSSVVQGVIAVVALAILAGGAYFMRINEMKSEESKNIVIPTENTESISTSDWQTYVNTKYRYDIKYPSNLNVYRPAHGEAALVKGTDDSMIMIADSSLKVFLSVNVYELGSSLLGTSYSSAKSLQEYLNLLSKIDDKGNVIRKFVKEVSIDGQSAQWYQTFEWSAEKKEYSWSDQIYIQKNNYIYEIYIENFSDKIKNNTSNIVFSTFKFTPTPNPLEYETPISEIRRIEVTSPKGGEVYKSGQKMVISWNDYHGPDADTYTIMLLGDKPAQVISNSFVSSSGLDGLSSIEWIVPNDLSGKYRIEVYKPGSRELVGRSNEFAIQQ